MYLPHGGREQAHKLEPLPHLVRVGEGVVALQYVLVDVHVLIAVQ